ncbi:MAG TPA: DUF5989 family protein [Acidobacteriota bacterium]|nr:DUF5989 family protein [Acidobacteriota bacterium]
MKLKQSLSSRFGILGELISFFWNHKWWWLTPMLFVLLLLGLFMVFASSSPIAPFIYTLF